MYLARSNNMLLQKNVSDSNRISDLLMRRFVRLRDIRIVARFGKLRRAHMLALIATRTGAHPWSPTSHHGSPGILDLKVSPSNLLLSFLGLRMDRNALTHLR